ncbi:MAG: hypothetical protein L6416_02045 [Candidatus Omnitrophica bacterium]|nr:hypothetical protein [Candidatus Omnitrophota bacterium]
MNKSRKVKYYLQDDGKFVIDNYDLAKPFASFFPGIAGSYGIPMWVFYVNRAQGIVSFGTENKKSAILEFFPANRAWQLVSKRGFRTFIKIKTDKSHRFYEPFRNTSPTDKLNLQRKMFISAEDFSVSEDNITLGLKTDAKYFTLANEPLACLIRNLTVKNTSRVVENIEIADGLSQVVPYGANDRFLKELGRTIEAWMQVKYVTKFKVPFYKLAVDPVDRPQVLYIKGGNFYFSNTYFNQARIKTSFIVDPQVIFGQMKSLNYPKPFCQKEFTVPEYQITSSKTPSAFSHTNVTLKPQQEVTIVSFIGYARDEKHLQTLISKTHTNEFLDKKYLEYKKEVYKVQKNIFTVSANPTYDLYCQQTYLDNVLRGGLPITLQGREKSHIYHVYSRKHGDLERDYNNFQTEATYFSQGNGNYRDVNQNRRNDVWFNADVRDNNVITFFNLIQLDGFNPLVVFGNRFKLRDEQAFKNIGLLIKNKNDRPLVSTFIKKQFSLGALFMFLENNEIMLKASKEKFLRELLSGCNRLENAEHGDGFWVDHWTYNLDALEAYLAIYPEKLRNILLEKKKCVFFNNFVKVKTRDEKYILYNDSVRQYHAVSVEEIEEDSALSERMRSNDWTVRTKNGKGSVYKTTLLVKMICLIANKMASLDAFGCGIEMEANKPGWYDALNGLPGLFGSSMCEAFELKRLIEFILDTMEELHVDLNYPVSLPKELYDFLVGIAVLVADNLKSKSANKDMLYWDKSYELKESYRKKIAGGINGRLVNIEISRLEGILNCMADKLEIATKRAKDRKSGLYHTYFINEVAGFDKIRIKGGFKTSKDGLVCVKPKKFRQKPLPLFLEAQVHALRTGKEKSEKKKLYLNTKKSALYDQALKMYKVNASLEKMSGDIGRARVFTPGWLENESIWLHMEYKFILELLRAGLYDEFFTEFKNVLIPYQPAERYGRSILENSSFIVSSAFPDKSMHGNGFVARLSGSTAEFMNMWLWMNVGKTPFRLNENKKLIAEFKPALAGWMFTKNKSEAEYCQDSGKKVKIDLPKGSYAFNFLSSTLVVYHNPKAKNTYGKDSVKPYSIEIKLRDGKFTKLKGSVIPTFLAEKLRAGEVRRMDIKFA